MKKITPLKKKVLSVILTLSVIIGIIPLSVFALSLKYDTPEPDVSIADKALKPIIIREATELREESVKHFLCDDGSYIAVNYTTPVHYLNEQNKWVEFSQAPDNSATNNKLTIGSPTISNTGASGIMTLDREEYKLTWSASEASFGDNSKTELSIANINRPVTNAKKIISPPTSLIKTKETTKSDVKQELTASCKTLGMTISANGELNISNQTKTKLETLNQSIEAYNTAIINNVVYDVETVEYLSAYGDGTTLRYTIADGIIKEDLILSAPSNFESYSIRIENVDLKAVKNENGSIDFLDVDNNSIFTIQQPMMYDSAKALSFEIDVALQTDGNEYIITYTPSAEWLNSADRIYPVTLDPTYSETIDVLDMATAYSYNVYPSQDYLSTQFMGVGSNGEDIYESWFVMLQLPSSTGKVITSSYVDFKVSLDFEVNIGINAYIPNRYFDPGLAWNWRPGLSHCMASGIPLTYSDGIPYYRIPLGVLPEQWEVNSLAQDYGIYLKGAGSENGFNMLYTNSSPTNKPMYIYEYYVVTEPSETLKTDIVSGVYKIKSYSNSNLYLTENTSGLKITSGASDVSSNEQSWYVENLGNGDYTFTPMSKINHRMNIYMGVNIDYAPVTTEQYTSNIPRVKFKIYSNSNGGYSIRPYSNTSYALSIYQQPNGSSYFFNNSTELYESFTKTYGSTCQLNLYGGASYQKWTFITLESYLGSNAITISNKPVYNSNNIMKYNDTQIVTADVSGGTWESTNTSIATVTTVNGRGKIRTKTTEGTVGILVKDASGVVRGYFNLNVYNQNSSANASLQSVFEKRGVHLDVPLVTQTYRYTCSGASAVMLLYTLDAYTGTDVDFFYAAGGTSNDDTPYAGEIINELNKYLPNNHEYVISGTPTVSEQETIELETEFYNKIKNSLQLGFPVQILVLPNSSFGYSTDNSGHYVVISGVYKNQNNQMRAVINDPFSASWSTTGGQIIDIDITNLRNACVGRGGYYFTVNS